MKAIEALIGWVPADSDSQHHWRTTDGELRCHATVYDLIEYLKTVDHTAPFSALEAVIRVHARGNLFDGPWDDNAGAGYTPTSPPSDASTS